MVTRETRGRAGRPSRELSGVEDEYEDEDEADEKT
jgi:hypothetical protein